MAEKPLITPQEAAARTGIPATTWLSWVKKGRIAFTQPTGPRGRVFLSTALVDRILSEANGTEGGAR